MHFLVGLLTAVFSLLGFVQQHPELPQTQQDQIQQVAQQAITQVSQTLASTTANATCTANGKVYQSGDSTYYTSNASGGGMPITDLYHCKDGQWYDAQNPDVPTTFGGYAATAATQ